MEYPNATVTIAGANLLAQTNGDGNDALIIDKAIASNKLSSSSTPLDQTTVDEFANPITTPITTVKHQDNTLQPEVTFHNDNLNEDYPIYMVGLLAHAKSDNSGNEILFGIAEADDDPMILPHKTDNEFDLDLAIPIGISNNSNVQIITTEAGTATKQDFDKLNQIVNNNIKTGTLSTPKWLDNSTDLNNVTDAGVYAFWQGVKNAPNNGMLLVYNSQAGDVFQVLYAAGGITYFRYKGYKKDFTQWVTMANNQDIDNLQNQINQNYTEANNSAKNAMNQANNYTDNKLNSVQRGTLSNPIWLNSNTDLNNIRTSGIYTFWTGLKNAPTNGMMVVHNNVAGQVYQTLYGGNSNIYIRENRWGNLFSTWKVIFSY